MLAADEECNIEFVNMARIFKLFSMENLFKMDLGIKAYSCSEIDISEFGG